MNINHSEKHSVGSADWRMERFSELRQRYPEFDTEEIWEALAQVEVDEMEARESARIASEMDCQ